MKATLNIELVIRDFEKTLQQAKQWERTGNYNYGVDIAQLIMDYILNEDVAAQFDYKKVDLTKEQK